MRYGIWAAGVLSLMGWSMESAIARGRSYSNVARRAVSGALNQANVPQPGNVPPNGNWNRNAAPYGLPQANQFNRNAPQVPQPYPVARNYTPPQAYPAYNTNVPYNYQRPVVPRLPAAAVPTMPTRIAPTPAAAQPTPAAVLAVHQSAAAHLYSQSRATTWDLYEHYDQSAGYAATYREMHRLLGLTKSVSEASRGQSTSAAASNQVIAWLHEIEVLLQVVQVQTADWTRDPGSSESSSRADLPTQLERIAATLDEVMTAYHIPAQGLAAADEEPATVIRARQ